jgi:hypothetical protein
LTLKAASILGAAIVASLLAESAALAKVAPSHLADLVREADFIGIVRVDRVGGRIPLIRPRRATATILQSWKGQREGSVTFVAQPTWSCDTSDARRGEEVVVFIEGDSLLLAGQGRMRIFERAGRRLATIWPGVLLPPDLDTEAGPEPEYGFLRGVGVDDLAAAVTASTPAAAAEE